MIKFEDVLCAFLLLLVIVNFTWPVMKHNWREKPSAPANFKLPKPVETPNPYDLAAMHKHEE